MGQPKGATTDKEFRNELRKVVHELRQADGDDKTKKVRTLRLIARKLADRAIDGDVPAITAIRDSLDGKPAQAVNVDMTVTVTAIERRIVDVIDVDCDVVEPAQITQDKSDT